jgi:hypothetical protein
MMFIPKVEYTIIMRLKPKINATSRALFETWKLSSGSFCRTCEYKSFASEPTPGISAQGFDEVRSHGERVITTASVACPNPFAALQPKTRPAPVPALLACWLD